MRVAARSFAKTPTPRASTGKLAHYPTPARLAEIFFPPPAASRPAEFFLFSELPCSRSSGRYPRPEHTPPAKPCSLPHQAAQIPHPAKSPATPLRRASAPDARLRLRGTTPP